MVVESSEYTVSLKKVISKREIWPRFAFSVRIMPEAYQTLVHFRKLEHQHQNNIFRSKPFQRREIQSQPSSAEKAKPQYLLQRPCTQKTLHALDLDELIV